MMSLPLKILRVNMDDDAAVHKGLTYANFMAAGEDPDHELIIADMHNSSFKNLKLDQLIVLFLMLSAQ